MRGPAIIGAVLFAAGALIWFTTPHHVTWGHHHYWKHLLSYGLMGAGALFVLVGARRG